MAVDERSEVSILIPQGTLPWWYSEQKIGCPGNQDNQFLVDCIHTVFVTLYSETA